MTIEKVSAKLEHILNNETFWPISFDDFYDYLLNVEHSIENLLFHYWFIQYCARFNVFNSKSSSRDLTLNITDHHSSASFSFKHKMPSHNLPLLIKKFLQNTDPSGMSTAEDIRHDIEFCTKVFLNSNSQYELNLSGSDKQKLLDEIKRNETVDPCHLQPVYNNSYNILKYNSFPNFIKLKYNSAFKLKSLLLFIYAQLAFILYIISFVMLFLFIYYFDHYDNSMYRMILFPIWFFATMMFLCVIYKFSIYRFIIFKINNSLVKFNTSKKEIVADDLKQSHLVPNESKEGGKRLRSTVYYDSVGSNYTKLMKNILIYSFFCSTVVSFASLSIPPYKF